MLWPSPVISKGQEEVISPYSHCGCLDCGGSVSSSAIAGTAWGTSGRGIFYPFTIGSPMRVVRAWTQNGATVAGNFDIGVYDMAGTKLGSTGSIAQAGASVRQQVDMTDFLLGPGVYYLAMATDSTTATYLAKTSTVELARVMGIYTAGAVFPLPSGVTYAVNVGALIFMFGIQARNVAV